MSDAPVRTAFRNGAPEPLNLWGLAFYLLQPAAILLAAVFPQQIGGHPAEEVVVNFGRVLVVAGWLAGVVSVAGAIRERRRWIGSAVIGVIYSAFVAVVLLLIIIVRFEPFGLKVG